MAVNKRKVLEAARKFAQKGAKEKALKEYNTLLKADPKDAKLLLEVGDAYRRWGQTDEAIAQYTRVADQYKQGGFDARAVAVFKQILNLDPKRYPAFVSLAELYQRMGLESEAVSALQTAADGYHKEGQKREALELLRKMATLDPSNTTSRMKVADLLRQEEMLEDAVSEYEAVAEELSRQGSTEALASVYERILEITPGRVDIQASLVRNLIDQSQYQRAEPIALQVFDAEPSEERFELLSTIYGALQRESELAEVTRKMAQIHRERGDEDKARELMQRLPVEDVFDVSLDEAEKAPVAEIASDLGGDDLLADDDFLDGGGMLDVDDDAVESDFVDISDDEDFDLSAGAPEPDFAEPPDAAVDAAESEEDESALPEGDPDQLFAEASVYLRYGKRDQAIASFRAILNQEPRHLEALEKIGECYADGGDDAKAVDFWSRAADVARESGDDATLEALRERIAVHDPEAAAELVPGAIPTAVDAATGSAGDAAGEDISGLGLDIDIDFSDDVDAAPAASASADDGGILLEDEADPLDLEMEVEDELDLDVEVATSEPDPLDEVAFDDEVDVDPIGEEEVDVGEVALDDELMSVDDALGTEDVASDDAIADALVNSSAGGGSSTQSQQIIEDLEEAEFYFAQELYDEAQAIYERILRIAPSHPSAMLRLGELQAARGEDPGISQTAPDIDTSLGENSELEIAVDIDVDDEADVDDDDGAFALDDGEEDLESAMAAAAAAVGDDAASEDDAALLVDDEVEIDLGEATDVASETVGEDTTETVEASAIGADIEFDLDSSSESPALSEAPGRDKTETFTFDEEPTIDDVEVAIDPADITEEAVEPEPEPIAAKPQLEETQPIVADDADEDDSFDLAAELRDSLDDEDEVAEPAAGPGFESTSEEEGFASIFKDFKAGVDRTLSQDDYETRFDLGIAYREMELYDDAIGEFRTCLASDSHRLESLHMMGLCAMNLNRADDAVNHFEQALATPDLQIEKRAGLHFDLGRAFEEMHDWPRAKHAYEAAREADPSIPGIDDQIAELNEKSASGAPLELEQDGVEPEASGFESFDDLVSEVEGADDDEEAPVVETFESFDDVIADAEIIDAEPECEPEAEPAPKPMAPPVASPTDGPDGPPKPRRKKKISFV